MEMIAALPMYDLPEIQEANDKLWRSVARRLRACGVAGVPASLSRDMPDLSALWRDPRLLLAQTCGYPLVTGLGRAVRLVAVPIYDFPGCTGWKHRSFIIAAAAAQARPLAGFRGTVCAVNGFDSNSGMNLLRAAVAPLAEGAPFFAGILETGSHPASLEAVADGRAALAAIDCVTHGHLARHRPALVARTRIVGQTPASPNLPMITPGTTSPEALAALRDALAETAMDPGFEPARRALGLTGLAVPPRRIYGRVSAL